MWITFYLALMALATALTWHGAVRLERTTEALAVHYRLPPVARGALLAAIGSSFPELSTTVLATALHGQFDLGVAVIVGSALFNILVIPGLSGILGDGLRVKKEFLYRDALFYISSVLALLLVFALAVVYHPDGRSYGGEMHRWLVVLPIVLYGFYLFTHHHDTLEERQKSLEKGTITADPDEGRGPVRKQWLLLVYSLGVILLGVEGLVRAAIEVGARTGTPSFLWGVTVLAAATSLPDAFVSTIASRQGEDSVSVGNVLGSNIFDLLIAIPVGVLIAGSATIDLGVAAPLMTALGLATLVFAVLLRTQLTLTKGESWVLLGVYGVFVTLMVLETAGVINIIVSGAATT